MDSELLPSYFYRESLIWRIQQNNLVPLPYYKIKIKRNSIYNGVNTQLYIYIYIIDDSIVAADSKIGSDAVLLKVRETNWTILRSWEGEVKMILDTPKHEQEHL